MSEVEQLWNRLRGHFSDTREWSQLNLQQQQVFIQGINNILAVFYKQV